MGGKIIVTTRGYKKLKEELKHLTTIKRAEVASKIKDAREMGDVLQNSVYDAAIEEQGYIEGRIREIEEILTNSEVVKVNRKSKTTVTVGSTVIVEINEMRDEFMIVGSAEADPIKKLISNESPVGVALLGAKIGDVVEVKMPNLKIAYKVIKIR